MKITQIIMNQVHSGNEMLTR